MDKQVQFQLKEVKRKKAEALKSRGSANGLIFSAIILLIVAFPAFAFLAYIFRPSGEVVDVIGAMQVIPCPGLLCFIFGIPGIIALPIGIVMRGNANKKLKAAEAEGQEIQKRLIALQKNKPQQ